MNPFRLRNYNETPPGQYPYRQFGAIPRDFPAQPIIEAQAESVYSFRKGNGLPRASLAEALEDVSRQTCKRLGNDPRWCVEDTAPLTVLPGTWLAAANCKGCGAKVD